jgi:hypothetical protein
VITRLRITRPISPHYRLRFHFQFLPPKFDWFLILVIIYSKISSPCNNVQQSLLLIRSLFLNFIHSVMCTNLRQIWIHNLKTVKKIQTYQILLQNVLILLHHFLHSITRWTPGKRPLNEFVIESTWIFLPNFLQSSFVDFIAFFESLELELF